MTPAITLAVPYLRRLWASIAPAVMILGFYVLTIGGTFWAGYTLGSTGARADAAKVKADTLTAHLTAMRVAADHITADRQKLANVAELLDKQAQDIRAAMRQRVKNENLEAWYQANANSVERAALYGLQPEPAPGSAVPDVRYLPDTPDPAPQPDRPRVAGAIP